MTSVEGAARQVHGSAVVDGLARLGLAARGLVWLVIALLAGSIAVGGGARAQADQEGALRALAGQPFGGVLLTVLAVGFAGYAVSLALGAAVGHRDEDGGERARHRLEGGGKAVLYAGLAALTARFLLAGGGGSGGDPAPSLTARVLQAPGGRLLVGLVGLAVLGVAGLLAWRAWHGQHREKIETFHVPHGWTATVVRVGTVGYAGRSLVIALVGGFLLRAGWQADPTEAKGLDAALSTLAGQPWGPVLLGVAVLGLLGYAAWSFLEAALHSTDG